jgi:hypothetical protein
MPKVKTGILVLSSAIGGILLFLLARTAYVYFSQGFDTPHVTVRYAPQYQEKFLELLDAAGIQYHVSEGGWVQYLPSDREKVEHIRSILFDYVGPAYSAIEVTKENREAAESDFKRNGIEYMIDNIEDKYMIRWRRKDNSKVHQMLQSAPYYQQWQPE